MHTIEISIADVIDNNGEAVFSIDGTKEVSNILTISEDEADPDGTGTFLINGNHHQTEILGQMKQRVLLPY